MTHDTDDSNARNENQNAEATQDGAQMLRNDVPAAPISRPRARRGFAVMDADRVREIARLGGKAAHDAGTAHEFTADEARSAGRKGGLAPHKPRRRKAEMAAVRAQRAEESTPEPVTLRHPSSPDAEPSPSPDERG